VTRLALAVGHAAGWLFLGAIGVTLWEVVARYAFDAPTAWAHALATLLCGVAFALGGAFALARDEHVRIGAVYERLRATLRRRIDLLGVLLGAVYLLGIGYGFWLQAHEAVWRFDWHGKWTPELTPGPPNWPLPAILRASLLVGTVLFLALLLVHGVRLLRRRP
jgi:TRAP-type C4-dicarboxylate transport system permease small subunit